MQPLYMVEMRPDSVALMRFLHGQGMLKSGADEDLGYGVHTWLAAAFSDMKPTSWRLLMDKQRPSRVLGYSYYAAEDLAQRMAEFAEPSVYDICPPDAIMSKQMPVWQSGRQLAFEAQVCPVGRKARSGVEKDLFLIRADADGSAELSREKVYCDWAKERLERDQAAVVHSIAMVGYRQVRQTRQTQVSSAQRERKHPIRPLVILQGSLTVQDPEAFANLVSRGVGRHRSFGNGMLLLRPPK